MGFLAAPGDEARDRGLVRISKAVQKTWSSGRFSGCGLGGYFNKLATTLMVIARMTVPNR